MSALTGLISGGKAFKNPMTGSISSLTSKIDLLQLDNPASPIYAELTPTQITEITTAFENIKTQMVDFQSHTDTLSGVNMGGDKGMAQMAQIMSVARVASGQQTCSEFNKAFGSIMNAAEIAAEIAALLLLIQQLIENPEAVIEELKNRLNAMTQRMADQIAADLQAFAQAQATALANAVGEAIVGLLGDNCFANVLGAVATDEMKKKIAEIKPPTIQAPSLK